MGVEARQEFVKFCISVDEGWGLGDFVHPWAIDKNRCPCRSGIHRGGAGDEGRFVAPCSPAITVINARTMERQFPFLESMLMPPRISEPLALSEHTVRVCRSGTRSIAFERRARASIRASVVR